MDPRLTSLLDLQEALSAQRELELEYKEIPARRSEIQAGLTALETEIEETANRLQTNQLEHKTRELELKSNQESRVKKEAQILAVKNTKEQEAINHEIEALDKKNARLEERILTLLDAIEKDTARLAEKKEALAQRTAGFQDELDRLAKAESSLTRRLEQAKAITQEIIPRINIALYRRFQKIFDSKNGVALTTANGGYCGACNIRLTPRTMQLAKRGQDIVTCEGCSRFLYWDESLEEDEFGAL